MGHHLRRAFGKRLVIIATTSMAESLGPLKAHPIDGSIDEALSRVGSPRVFVDLRMAKRDPAALAWLSQQRPLREMRSHGLIIPSTAADVFVYIDRLTPAAEIKRADSAKERPSTEPQNAALVGPHGG